MKRETLINILKDIGFGKKHPPNGDIDKFIYRDNLSKVSLEFDNDSVNFYFFTNLFFISKLNELDPEILFFELGKFLNSRNFLNKKLEILRDYRLSKLI